MVSLDRFTKRRCTRNNLRQMSPFQRVIDIYFLYPFTRIMDYTLLSYYNI